MSLEPACALVSVVLPRASVGLTKLPVTYTKLLATDTAVARLRPVLVPVPFTAHAKPVAAFHLATNASWPLVVLRVLLPKVAVPAKPPAKYTLPVPSVVLACTCTSPAAATAVCQVRVWARVGPASSHSSTKPSKLKPIGAEGVNCFVMVLRKSKRKGPNNICNNAKILILPILI